MKSWRTHDCELKKEKEKPPAEAGRKGITILPSILEYVDPNMWFHLQHCKNLNQVFNNPNSQSFSLFFLFFFERSKNRDDTAFENCSCLAT